MFSYFSRNREKEHKLYLFFLGFLCIFTLLQIVTFEYYFVIERTNFVFDRSRLNINTFGKLRIQRTNKWWKQKRPEVNSIAHMNEQGIRPLEAILKSAGVDVTEEIQKSLPPLDDIVNAYSDHPIIIGEERCHEFQSSIPREKAFLAPAGMFNTGTNLLESLLSKNCYLAEKVEKYGEGHIGIRYQVPWGKHSPVSWRFKHTAPTFEGIDHSSFLAAVVIKDPYTWMTSMCRHNYAASWRNVDGHCPNLVPITSEEEDIISPRKTFQVTINYHKHNVTRHESMAELYNEWYGDWLDADFPRLMVRFEDLLFHAEEVVERVCKCGGGVMNGGPFQYVQDSAKKGTAHKGSNGLVKSMLQYGNVTKRIEAYSSKDLQYAESTLRSDVLDLFHYSKVTV
mmetsp:Transcript_17148/g.32470  ORF Transcript_17148/g.32470 Transcript_17148/m.32470 type:complete len:396 (+) Transcript_17148:63-1250(+)